MWTLNVAVILLLEVTVGLASSLEKTFGSSVQLKTNLRKARALQFIKRPENEDGCKPLNTSCFSHSQCCLRNGRCVGNNDADSVCKKCKEIGEDCDANRDCCQAFLCQNRKCVCFQDGESCQGHGTCCGSSFCGRSTSSNKTCIPCGTRDEPCDTGNECCNGKCNVQKRVCHCTPSERPCASSLECCPDFKCLNGACLICVTLGGICRNDSECCTKNCTMGVCNCKRKLSRKKRCILRHEKELGFT